MNSRQERFILVWPIETTKIVARLLKVVSLKIVLWTIKLDECTNIFRQTHKKSHMNDPLYYNHSDFLDD